MQLIGERPTDQPNNRPTDIVLHRAAIAAKNRDYMGFLSAVYCIVLVLSSGPTRTVSNSCNGNHESKLNSKELALAGTTLEQFNVELT